MNFTSSVILAQTSAPPAKAPPPPDAGLQGMNMMMMVAFFFALVYFLSIRPQSKRQKELQARINALKTGDKVITTGGIHGVVANVKDGATLTLKVADNVKIELDKTAVATVVQPEGSKPHGAAAATKTTAGAK